MLNPVLYSFASEWMRVHIYNVINQYRYLRFLCGCFKGVKDYQSAEASVYSYRKPRSIQPSRLTKNLKGTDEVRLNFV